MVKNIDGHVIYFCDEAARFAKPDTKYKNKPVVGIPVVSVKTGDNFYHGLCDLGASVSAIPFTLYQEIMNDIAPAEMEDIDVTIKLLIEIPSHHLGLLEMLKSFMEKQNALLVF